MKGQTSWNGEVSAEWLFRRYSLLRRANFKWSLQAECARTSTRPIFPRKLPSSVFLWREAKFLRVLQMYLLVEKRSASQNSTPWRFNKHVVTSLVERKYAQTDSFTLCTVILYSFLNIKLFYSLTHNEILKYWTRSSKNIANGLLVH